MSLGRGPLSLSLSVLQRVASATDLDLISYLKAIPEARMHGGVYMPAWYLLLVAVLGILSKCDSLRDLVRFARRHHAVLVESLGVVHKRPPSEQPSASSTSRMMSLPSEPSSGQGPLEVCPSSSGVRRSAPVWCAGHVNIS
jgi:hypothetical protein